MKHTGMATDDATAVAVEILQACQAPFYPHKFIRQLERNIEDLQNLVHLIVANHGRPKEEKR